MKTPQKYKKNKVKWYSPSAAGLLLLLAKFGFDFIEEKIYSTHFLHFAFEKYVPSQVLQDFFVENLEITPRSIYLELSIIGVVFFLFLSVFSLKDTKD